ncbi:MAG: hypothetical protein F2MM_05415 [Candidatus Midichloria mitochondrii]
MIDLKPNLEDCGIRTIERLTGIHNSQISSWIEGRGRYVQEKLDKSCNSTKSLKDIEVLEIDELCTYIKKTKEWKWEYTFILIAVDRGAGEIIDFEGRLTGARQPT